MKLEMKTLYASAERTVQPGQIAQFPTEEAEALIAGGFAVPAEDGAASAVRTRPVAQPAKQAPARKPAGKAAPTQPNSDGDGDGGGAGDQK